MHKNALQFWLIGLLAIMCVVKPMFQNVNLLSYWCQFASYPGQCCWNRVLQHAAVSETHPLHRNWSSPSSKVTMREMSEMFSWQMMSLARGMYQIEQSPRSHPTTKSSRRSHSTSQMPSRLWADRPLDERILESPLVYSDEEDDEPKVQFAVSGRHLECRPRTLPSAWSWTLCFDHWSWGRPRMQTKLCAPSKPWYWTL